MMKAVSLTTVASIAVFGTSGRSGGEKRAQATEHALFASLQLFRHGWGTV